MPRFSKKYQDFDIEYKSVLAYITANQATLGITPEQVTTYTATGVLWSNAYTAYSDANTRTAPDIAEVATQFAFIRHDTNVIQQQIKNDASITLSEEARIALYIHLDKTTRTPATRPDVAPVVVVLSSVRLVSKISVTVPTSDEENHRGLPIGTRSIARLVAVTETGVAPAREAFNSIASTGHTVSTIEWDEGNAGHFGWVICQYENTAGQGPESAPLMVAIVT